MAFHPSKRVAEWHPSYEWSRAVETKSLDAYCSPIPDTPYYVSGYNAAMHILDFQHVLPKPMGFIVNVSDEDHRTKEKDAWKAAGLLYLYEPLLDECDQPLFTCADAVSDAMQAFEQAHPQVPILIHCHVGMSRSVSVLLAHMLKTHQCVDYDTGLSRIQKGRTIAQPNDGFETQLRLYARQKLDKRATEGLQDLSQDVVPS